MRQSTTLYDKSIEAPNEPAAGNAALAPALAFGRHWRGAPSERQPSTMNIKSGPLLCFAVLLSAQILAAGQDSFTNESEIETFLHDNFDGKSFGMVVGLVDEHGGKVFNAGKLDNNTDRA